MWKRAKTQTAGRTDRAFLRHGTRAAQQRLPALPCPALPWPGGPLTSHSRYNLLRSAGKHPLDVSSPLFGTSSQCSFLLTSERLLAEEGGGGQWWVGGEEVGGGGVRCLEARVCRTPAGGTQVITRKVQYENR